MNQVVITVLVLSALLIFAREIHVWWEVSKLKKRGLYPLNEKQAVMVDVERLLKHGERLMAIRLYRKMHPGISLPKACEAIKKLDRQSTSA